MISQSSWGKRGRMILRLNDNPTIDNLRHYPAETVQALRELLAQGARVYPDPQRKNFYDVENGSRMFYIHLSPAGRVWLLATWLKDGANASAPSKALIAEVHA